MYSYIVSCHGQCPEAESKVDILGGVIIAEEGVHAGEVIIVCQREAAIARRSP